MISGRDEKPFGTPCDRKASHAYVVCLYGRYISDQRQQTKKVLPALLAFPSGAFYEIPWNCCNEVVAW